MINATKSSHFYLDTEYNDMIVFCCVSKSEQYKHFSDGFGLVPDNETVKFIIGVRAYRKGILMFSCERPASMYEFNSFLLSLSLNGNIPEFVRNMIDEGTVNE